jgi:hypothetical protein
MHFFVGYSSYYFFQYINISPMVALITLFILHTIYEIRDLTKLYNKNDAWSDNSLINSIGDTIFFILGMLLAMNTPINIWYLTGSLFLTLLIYLFFINSSLG